MTLSQESIIAIVGVFVGLAPLIAVLIAKWPTVRRALPCLTRSAAVSHQLSAQPRQSTRDLEAQLSQLHNSPQLLPVPVPIPLPPASIHRFFSLPSATGNSIERRKETQKTTKDKTSAQLYPSPTPPFKGPLPRSFSLPVRINNGVTGNDASESTYQPFPTSNSPANSIIGSHRQSLASSTPYSVDC